MKIKHVKNFNNLWHYKYGANVLIKLIRLMEVTERHNFIRTRGSDLAFGIWDSWFEQEMISLEESWLR